MRMPCLAIPALALAFSAAAQPPDRPVNLDRPGALAALEKQKPDHYRAVLQTVHATQRMHCAVDLKALRVGDRNPCRSYIIRTSYPAQVYLSIPLDDVRYQITAYLDTSLDRATPAKAVAAR